MNSVYQRGWVINSQHEGGDDRRERSISKGMGDQFSARLSWPICFKQYIKGDG